MRSCNDFGGYLFFCLKLCELQQVPWSNCGAVQIFSFKHLSRIGLDRMFVIKSEEKRKSDMTDS